MPVSDVVAALRRHLRAGHKVRLTRGRLGDEYWSGYPLDMSEDYVLMRTLDDFNPDGFAVLRIEDLTEVRCGDAERFFDFVLQAEGLLKDLPKPPPIRLDSWQSILEDILRYRQYAILECEALEEPEFYLGKLVDVTPLKVSLHYINIKGIMEDAITEVPLEDLTIVRFDEKYIQYFSRYARGESALH